MIGPGELVGEVVPVGSLAAFPGNPRRGDLATIRASLAVHGQYRPLVANRRTRRVLCGNHTLRAAAELGWELIAVTWVDVDEAVEPRIVAVDNRSNDLAGYDSEELLELLSNLEGLDGTGYEQSDLDALLDEVGPGALEEDELPALPVEPVTKPRELVELGEHRLLCGDARDPEVYGRLLGDERPALLWTDPPYGVSYEGKTSAGLTIANDSSAEIARLLRDSFAVLDRSLTPGAPVYTCHPAGALQAVFIAAFLEAGWSLRQTLIWLKDSMVLGRSDYHYKHEPILYGYKPAASGRLGRGSAGWHGDNSQTSVFELDRPRVSAEHPTMKPPELIEVALRNSSQRRDVVLDPFAGSGSTLVACERLGRRARLIEIDPRYCDVIISRYEALTGRLAARAAV